MADIIVAGNTSGSVTISAPSVAGSGTLTLPVATDTLVGKATTDTLTNKTLVAPALGTPASGVLTNCTGLTAAALPAGSVLQVKNYQVATAITATTQIPFDNTIPQITEGGQILTLSITPTSATSKLYIQVNYWWSVSAAAHVISALFQDSTANSLASTTAYMATVNGTLQNSMNYFMTSGTTSSTTFTVRVGPGSAATVTINGNSGTQYLGGVGYSSITITEIAA